MADDTKTEPIEGQSFYNEALTGSGTITHDGTYADPLPDPTEIRGQGPRRTSGGRLLPELPSTEVDAAYAEVSVPRVEVSEPAEPAKQKPAARNAK
jgi:hypothetical protein